MINKNKKNKNCLEIYFEQIKNHKILSKKEEKKLSLKIKNGSMEARDELIKNNLKLVVDIAKRFTTNGISINDLIQEGNIGLIKAAEKFDSENFNVKFSTYAFFWIRQYITRAIINQSRNIKIPVYVQEALNLIQRKRKNYIEKNKKEPSINELSKLTTIPVLNIINYIEAYKVCDTVSLNDPVCYNSESNYNNFLNINSIIHNDNNNEDYEIDKSKLLKKIEKKVNKITDNYNKYSERNKIMYFMRIGLQQEELNNELTLSKIGDKFSITKERVRQITKSINSKIKTDDELNKMFKEIITK